MKTLNKKEALVVFDKLSELAHGLAEALGTTPENCKDPICKQYCLFSNIETMTDDELMVLQDNDEPVIIFLNYHNDKSDRTIGIICLPMDSFERLYVEDDGLFLEYRDGIVERLQYVPPADAYYIHSTNAQPVPNFPSIITDN